MLIKGSDAATDSRQDQKLHVTYHGAALQSCFLLVTRCIFLGTLALRPRDCGS